MNQERLLHAEALPQVEIPHSIDIFDGNMESGVSEAFNEAVITVQRAMGSEFYLTPASFGEIMPGDWQGYKAAKALETFDRAYQKFVLEKMGYSAEEIEIVAIDNEGEAPDISELGDGQTPFNREFADIAARYDELDAAQTDKTLSSRLGDLAVTKELLAEGEISDPVTTSFPAEETGVRGKAEFLESQSSGQLYEPAEATAERAETLRAFAELIDEHPEVVAQQAQFLEDLEKYLGQKYHESETASVGV